MGYEILPFEDIFEEYMKEPSDNLAVENNDEMSIYMLSNLQRINGAICIMYEKLLYNFANNQGVDEVYIIPSSVHEVLLIPKKENIKEADYKLLKIIKQINADIMQKDEILSENLYVYKKKYNEIVYGAMLQED